MECERTELQEVAWVDYYQSFYSNDEADAIYAQLRDELE